MIQKNLDRLISEALAIEAEEAQSADALGFMARALTLATMPHRQVAGNEFERTNGAFTLSLLAPSKVGLPYGSLPRLLMAWLTTEAVKTKQRDLVLGDSMTAFMAELGLVPTGGRWGSITRLKEQTRRLFASSVTCIYGDDQQDALVNVRLVSKAQLWWNPKQPDQAALWQSTVSLTQEFFEEVITRPVPVDLRALKALKQSPLALDMYIWLTYRLSYLKHRTEIPWPALQLQFGADYSLDAQGTRNFKRKFLSHLGKIHALYPEARIHEGDKGLVLSPSKPHVPRLKG
jgi:hypothetical protein